MNIQSDNLASTTNGYPVAKGSDKEMIELSKFIKMLSLTTYVMMQLSSPDTSSSTYYYQTLLFHTTTQQHNNNSAINPIQQTTVRFRHQFPRRCQKRNAAHS